MKNAKLLCLAALLSVLVPVSLFASVWATQQELERARWRAEQLPWAHKVADRITRSADEWLSNPLPFPQVLTGYFHDYFCPKHAVQLLFDPQSPHRHFCPIDSQVFTGPKYDAAWAFLVHLKAQSALENLSLAYVLTGDREYAEAALAWLRKVRDVYPSLPPHGEHAGLGKLMGQSLDEAVWAVSATGAYHILRREGLVSDSEHRLFVRRLWRPMSQLLERELRSRGRIHNITCWRDAGVAGLAVVMGDRALLRRVLLSSDFSLQKQLLQGVASDGLWYEGSLGYHFYALQALLIGAKVATLEKLDLGPARERLVKMLTAPVRLADQAGHLPALNDGWPDQRLQNREGLYELGSSLFPGAGQDSVAAWLVSHGASRGVEALLYGPDSLVSGKLQQGSSLFPETGLAVLRKQGAYALLKFGPHGGGHGHFDKLEFVLSLHGVWVSPDFGTAGYGIPAYREWYKRTASHNCVIVDGKTQKAGSGELLTFGRAGPWQVVRARSDQVVPGVVLDRTLALGDSFLLVVDLVDSDQPHALDWHFRAKGLLETDLVLQNLERPLAGEGYSYYSRVRWTVPGSRWAAGWQTPAGPLRLIQTAGPGDTLFVGDEPGIPATHRYPFVLLRRRARRTIFAALLTWRKVPVQAILSVAGAGDEGDVQVRVRRGVGQPTRFVLKREVTGEPRRSWVAVEEGGRVWSVDSGSAAGP